MGMIIQILEFYNTFHRKVTVWLILCIEKADLVSLIRKLVDREEEFLFLPELYCL